jgi:tetratricopeptide (TPR) repeat protein
MNNPLPEKDSSIRRGLEFIRHNRPLRTEEVCRDYLLNHPGCADHMRLLGLALVKQKRIGEAEEQLRTALQIEPDFPQLHEDLGSALVMQSKFEEAIPEFERAIQLQPTLPDVERKLGEALLAVGRTEEAEKLLRDYVDKDPERSEIFRSIDMRRDGKEDEAIEMFREVLKKNPNSVNAMRHLAECYWRGKQRYDDAEALLRRAVKVAPDFAAAWLTLARLLMDMNRYVEAIEAYEAVTRLEPDNADAWGGLGNANGRAMYSEKAVVAYEKSLAIRDGAPGILAAYAWELKTLGRQEDALDAYRRSIKANPRHGPAYWSMANLKIFKFEDEEVDAMLGQVESGDLAEVDDIHMRFALGKAMEDRKDYERAWHFYHTGNQKQRVTVEHEPSQFEKRLNDIKEIFNKELLDSRTDAGFDAPDPIFIVGLPRSGSTLVEQILASHSQVEGTAELPILGRIAESIGRYRTDGARYPEAVCDLRDKDLRAYGKEYIEQSRRFRMTDKPLFTDKLPNNYPLMGFAAMILPNAKIINARRHPFDSCLGAYKQLFGAGQNFTYDILDLAHYYQQYDAMMKHWHSVLPGKVLDVHYEETVTDLEGQVQRILEHCGLPFEESCVRFHETERAVKTASSEQVRQPIYTSGLGKWRRYESHLDMWQEYLADIVSELPEVSQNAGLNP